MRIFLTVVAYAVYAAFAGRFLWHVLLWMRAGSSYGRGASHAAAPSFYLCSLMVLDLVLFRRLFSSSKILWLGSWTFHVMFLLVVLRHLRYFLSPVPGCITFIQPFGVFAGYLLAAGVIFILIVRLLRKEGYVSPYNYFLLGMVLAISLTGLLMRNALPPDLVAVKAFIIDLLTFRRAVPPGSGVFILHFLLVLVLVPYLPFHLFAAPLITIEARRREEGLKTVVHDREDKTAGRQQSAISGQQEKMKRQ